MTISIDIKANIPTDKKKKVKVVMQDLRNGEWVNIEFTYDLNAEYPAKNVTVWADRRVILQEVDA